MPIVSDVMTPNPDSVGSDASIEKVAGMMRDGDYGVVPIVDTDGSLIGIVTDRDIVISALAEGMGPETAVSQCMTANPDSVPRDITLEQAGMLMSKQQIRRLPVVESGKLIGMLSLADVATSTAPDAQKGDVLEEISVDGTTMRESNTYSGEARAGLSRVGGFAPPRRVRATPPHCVERGHWHLSVTACHKLLPALRQAAIGKFGGPSLRSGEGWRECAGVGQSLPLLTSPPRRVYTFSCTCRGGEMVYALR